MSKIKLEIRRYRVPIIREPNKDNPEEVVVSYTEVPLDDYYKDKELIELDNVEGLADEGAKLNAYNSRQLTFAQNDNSIETVYKKVLCKPKQ